MKSKTKGKTTYNDLEKAIGGMLDNDFQDLLKREMALDNARQKALHPTKEEERRKNIVVSFLEEEIVKHYFGYEIYYDYKNLRYNYNIFPKVGFAFDDGEKVIRSCEMMLKTIQQIGIEMEKINGQKN